MRQQRMLLKRQIGVGVMAYHAGQDTTCEVHFFVGRDGTLRFVANHQPLTLTVTDEKRNVHTVAVKSKFKRQVSPSSIWPRRAVPAEEANPATTGESMSARHIGFLVDREKL